MANGMVPLAEYAFGGNSIRIIGTDRDCWFVAQDVALALGITWKGKETLSCLPNDWISLRKLRTHVMQRDGTYRVATIDMLCVNEYGLYKLTFRSNKPSADAFTNWVASEVLPAIRKKGTYTVKRRQKYIEQGKSPEWIDNREEGIDTRKTYTDVLGEHGVDPIGYAHCTNAIYRPLFGGTASGVKIKMGLKPKANLRDSLSSRDLTLVKFAEMLAGERIEADDLQGNTPCQQASLLASQIVAQAEKMSKEAALPPSTQPRLGQ